MQGQLLHPDLLKLYQAADVFIMPSIVLNNGGRDGIPNVVIEAMATGIPVVGSNAAGIPEVVKNRSTGLLVPPGDPERNEDGSWRSGTTNVWSIISVDEERNLAFLPMQFVDQLLLPGVVVGGRDSAVLTKLHFTVIQMLPLFIQFPRVAFKHDWS